MSERYDTRRELLHLMTRPVFLLADLLGVTSLLFSQFVSNPWTGALAAVGSVAVTIGVSLPIGLFYQFRAEAKSLEIIDACRRAGIKAVFRSRLSDAQSLGSAIDVAARASNKIRVLGVALPSFFDPSGEHTPYVNERLEDPDVCLDVLLLDPDSDAARRRAEVERGHTTIDDICHTLEHSIPSVIEERVKRLCQRDAHFKAMTASRPWSQQVVDEVANRCNCKVHLYELDPIMFLMVFADSIFVEQYHLGRPEGLRARSCVGKHVPVLEYASSAEAASFLLRHYDTLWMSYSKDVTVRIVGKLGQ